MVESDIIHAQHGVIHTKLECRMRPRWFGDLLLFWTFPQTGPRQLLWGVPGVVLQHVVELENWVAVFDIMSLIQG